MKQPAPWICQMEKLIMREIDSFKRSNTMFIVAHRLSSLKGCNRIIKVENDHTISELSYSDLLKIRYELYAFRNCFLLWQLCI